MENENPTAFPWDFSHLSSLKKGIRSEVHRISHNLIYHKTVDKSQTVVYNDGMKEKKYFIDTILEKEKQRNENMRIAYEKRIMDLPRGSLVIRELNGKKYCYLRYREGKKVIQKYAGTIDKEEMIRAKIAKRKHLAGLLTMLEEENKRILKMEAIK